MVIKCKECTMLTIKTKLCSFGTSEFPFKCYDQKIVSEYTCNHNNIQSIYLDELQNGKCILDEIIIY